MTYPQQGGPQQGGYGAPQQYGQQPGPGQYPGAAPGQGGGAKRPDLFALVGSHGEKAVAGLGIVGFFLGFGSFVSIDAGLRGGSASGSFFEASHGWINALLLLAGLAAAIGWITKEKWGIGVAAAASVSATAALLCTLQLFDDTSGSGWAFWVVFAVGLVQSVIAVLAVLMQAEIVGGAKRAGAGRWDAPRPGAGYGPPPQAPQYGQAPRPPQQAPYGAPPQAYGQPGQAPYGQQHYGAPPQQSPQQPYGGQQQRYGQPPQGGGYGAQPSPQYGQGARPGGPGYGQAPQQEPSEDATRAFDPGTSGTGSEQPKGDSAG